MEAPARAKSEPPPEPASDRYRVVRPLWDGRVLAHDELLERAVEILRVDAGTAERLRAFARADGPYLQAVYEVDEAQGRAVLEHPAGDALEHLGSADPRRARAIGDVRAALKRLHAERVVHGAVDPRHIVVGRARACLRISLAAASDDARADWAGLDALGGRSAR